jgi:hypothetical protein
MESEEPPGRDKGRKNALRVFRPHNVLIIAFHPISKPPVLGQPHAAESKKRGRGYGSEKLPGLSKGRRGVKPSSSTP